MLRVSSVGNSFMRVENSVNRAVFDLCDSADVVLLSSSTLFVLDDNDVDVGLVAVCELPPTWDLDSFLLRVRLSRLRKARSEGNRDFLVVVALVLVLVLGVVLLDCVVRFV